MTVCFKGQLSGFHWGTIKFMFSLYKHAIRPLLFRLEPEKSQGIVESILKYHTLWQATRKLFEFEDHVLGTTLAGIELANPIGLAAGYDKNCLVLPSMAMLGFGYVVGGTITRNPSSGNPKPRVMRLKENEALINSLGFPGVGLDATLASLSKTPFTNQNSKRILSISGTEISDILECHNSLEQYGSAIEVNISSPNTAGLRIFQDPKHLVPLIEGINYSRSKPLFVKLPPYDSRNPRSSKDAILELVRVCVEYKVDCVTIANTLPTEEKRLAVGKGGLSGSPLFPNTLQMVRDVHQEFGDLISINASGGVSTGKQVYALLTNGASSVQLYTSLVYQGPWLIKRMKKELAEEIKHGPILRN